MTTSNLTYRAPDAEVLNDCLTRLLLMPVESIANLGAGTDAFIVLQRLVSTHRQLSSRGWYCYNRQDRVKLTYAADQFTVAMAHSVSTAVRMPTDPDWPRTRPEFQGIGQPMRIVRLDTGLSTFTPSEQSILFDVVYAKDFGNAPPVYQQYLVMKTVNSIAPVYGVNIDRAAENEALNALTAFEQDFMPSANVFTDTADALLVWAR